MLPTRIHAAAVLALLGWAGTAHSQTPPPQDPSQFDVVGIIQEATLDACVAGTPPAPGATGAIDPAWQTCGGTIRVNNQTIVVPKNTILQMPASAPTWFDVFYTAPAPYGNGSVRGAGATPLPAGAATAQSGLAQNDSPKPLATYEAHVIGNRVGNTYIAGLMYLSQHSLQSGQGFISSIDYTTGTFEVGGKMNVANTGQKVKINDPLGRFGRAWSPDVRFTIDENNPTIRSETGFPMCLPRTTPPAQFAAETDPACPQANRPLDATSPSGYMMQIAFPYVNATIAAANTPINQTPYVVGATTLDPRFMVPFEVGDFVTYSGMLITDAATQATVAGSGSGRIIAAYSLIANVGLFTAAGDDLAYVAVDVTLLGVGGVTLAGLTEATARTRFEGFTTDPTRNILLYAVDVDPCTGANPDPLRSWGSMTVDPGPPAGAVLGRWRFRPPSKVLTMPPAGTFLPPTRELRAALQGGVDLLGNPLPLAPYATSATLGNQTDASLTQIPGSGYYQSPIAEFLFPENAGAGTPIVPNNFEDMPFLAQGNGPNADGVIIGQLNPWPGAAATKPALPACQLQAPVASAGPAQTVGVGAIVTLDGSASTDPQGLSLTTYAWNLQSATGLSSSPPASLTGVAPTFTAPSLLASATPGSIVYSLVVTDSGGVSSTNLATVTITVTGAPAANAGAAQTVLPGQAVTLDGSASVNAKTYQWTYVGCTVLSTGSACTNLTWPTSFSPVANIGTGSTAPFNSTAFGSFTAPSTITAPSNLVFQLVVKNAAGQLSSPSTVTITVNPLTAPTALVAVSYKDVSGTTVKTSLLSSVSVTLSSSNNGSVALDGTKSTPLPGFGGTTYTWTQPTGPAQTISTGNNGATATVSIPSLAPGATSVTLGFVLTVANSKGTATAKVTITVNAPPPPKDTVTIVLAQYSSPTRNKSRMTVDANSSADPTANPAGPNPTMSFIAYDSKGKQLYGPVQMPWSTVLVPPAYDATFVGQAKPARVVVTSSFGGQATACDPTYAAANPTLCVNAVSITLK